MRKSSALAIGFHPPVLETLRGIEPSCELLAANESAEALTLLKERKFNAIFVDARLPEVSPRDFSQLRKLVPDVPTAVVGPPPPTAVLARLADDTAVSFLPLDQPQASFWAAARKLLLPRGWDRLAMPQGQYRVEGRIDGRPFGHSLRDLSNRGLSLSVPIADRLAAFLPGAVITDLTVRDRDGRGVLGPLNATIRYTQTDHGTEEAPLFVGVAFDSQTTVVSPHRRVIKDPLPILASLRKAIQAGTAFVVGLPDDESGFRFPEGRIELAPEPLLSLPGPVPSELRAHDAVRLSFGHHGQSYVGLTAVVDAGDSLRLAMPRTLRVYHRRGSPRHRPTPERPYRVQLRAPLTGCDDSFSVHDLNATGLSVEVDSTRHVLPPGMVIEELVLAIPDGRPPLRVRGIVRTLRALPQDHARGEASLARCGIEFVDLVEDDRRRLCDSLLVDGFPHVEPARPSDFEAVRQLIKDASFGVQLYGDGSEDGTRILRYAFDRLGGPARKVGVNLLYRRDGVLHGHITALHLYSRTWMGTHLVTAHQGVVGGADRASRALTLGISEYIEHEPSAEFVKMVWANDRRFADRMFGWVGRMIHQPGLADGRDFSNLVRPNAAGPLPMPAGMVVQEAEPAELDRVERYFARHVNAVRIWAEDLTRDRLLLGELNDLYGSCGLQRRRAVHMAYLDGALAGFSLLELTTPGLQMSDMASGFDVFVFPEVPEEEHARVRSALIADAVSFYAAAGVPYSVAMTEVADQSVFTASGFSLKCQMRTRLWHRSLFRSWADYSEQVLRGVQERAQRRAQRWIPNDLVHPGGESGRDPAPDHAGEE